MNILEKKYRLPIETESGQNQDALHKMLQNLDPNEFTFFHLTTTYLPYKDHIYTERDVSKFYINFYLKSLLPEIFHTRNWTQAKKLKQPLVFSFLDEHEIEPTLLGSSTSKQPIFSFPTRLHHHTIIASRACTTDFFRSHVGTNTMLQYSNKFMTTDLKECDPDRMLYASKLLNRYPNFLSFGYQ